MVELGGTIHPPAFRGHLQQGLRSVGQGYRLGMGRNDQVPKAEFPFGKVIADVVRGTEKGSDLLFII